MNRRRVYGVLQIARRHPKLFSALNAPKAVAP